MSIAKMREELKKAYPHHRWATRVNKMPDDQVVAVYNNLKQQNKL